MNVMRAYRLHHRTVIGQTLFTAPTVAEKRPTLHLVWRSVMITINVPTREKVSPANQAIFDNLKKNLGVVPNLYATLAHSEHALGNYLAFQNGKSSITGKAREVVNLVV